MFVPFVEGFFKKLLFILLVFPSMPFQEALGAQAPSLPPTSVVAMIGNKPPPPSPPVIPWHGTAPARKQPENSPSAPAAAPPGMEFHLPPPPCGAAGTQPPAPRSPRSPLPELLCEPGGAAKATSDQKNATTTTKTRGGKKKNPKQHNQATQKKKKKRKIIIKKINELFKKPQTQDKNAGLKRSKPKAAARKGRSGRERGAAGGGRSSPGRRVRGCGARPRSRSTISPSHDGLPAATGEAGERLDRVRRPHWPRSGGGRPGSGLNGSRARPRGGAARAGPRGASGTPGACGACGACSRGLRGNGVQLKEGCFGFGVRQSVLQ